jgi:membrane associated rhomboid family serine protease
VFVASAVIAGIVYSLVPGLRAALIGAFPPVYGLIGAFTFIRWARLGALNANRTQAFSLIGFLLGIQLVFGAIFGGDAAWIADITGFAVGFGLSFLVGPGGPARMIRAARQR